MAVASSPGLAYAEPSDSSVSAGTAPAVRSGATHAAAAAPARTRRQQQSGARPAASTSGNSSAAAAAVGRAPRAVRVPAISAAAPSVTVAVAGDSTAPQSSSTPSSNPSVAASVAAQNPVDAVGHAVTATVAQLIDAVLAPLADGGPLSPTGSPLLWTALAWARRELGEAGPGTPTAAVTTTSLTMSDNLIANGGAESGDPSLSGNSSVSVPGWTVTGTPTVIKYGTPRNMWPVGLPSATPNLPAFMGFPTGGSSTDQQFFGGGNVATSTLTQLVALTGPSAAGVTYDLSAQLGGWLINPGAASVKVDFLDANQTYLGTAAIGPVNLFDRFFQTTLLDRSTTGTLPTGTQYARVTVNLKAWTPIFPGLNADYNSAFADNISLTVSDTGLAPAPQPVVPVASTVGQLDHVYMVYMENKGYDDIVGSPDAPFLNSLINAYGFANNYYALTHGSLPNYYPVLGGTDYGITYNCGEPCINADLADTLVGKVEAAGLTWKGYAQGLAVGGNPLVETDTYATDQLPFLAFDAIANDPAQVANLVSLDLLATDLQSVATAPNYAWFAANESQNGEGPVSTLDGKIKFVLSQIDPKHRYNIKGLDQFLADNVPTILNSNAWNSAESSALVVTFDEDNNNTSLGFGNEGNHIVTVVIPNQAAIAAGMRGGAFTDTTHYDHYSLLNMIETSLGLVDPVAGTGFLTNNDKYAPPMNGFWSGTGQAGAGSVV